MYENIFWMKYWYITLGVILLIVGVIGYYIYHRMQSGKVKAKKRVADAVILGAQKITPKTVSLDEVQDWQNIRIRKYHNKSVLFLEEAPITQPLVVSAASTEDKGNGGSKGGNGKKDLSFLGALGQKAPPATIEPEPPKPSKPIKRRRGRKKGAKHAVTQQH